MPGTLYIVATPIGNLSDISPRAKDTLAEVDLILAEDTRVTIKLLNHLGIKKRMVSCHDFNERSRLKIISDGAGLNQKIALISDAGTPLISDPGHEIIKEAIDSGMNIIPIAGPSAFLLALVASGLPCDRFIFEGFLPNKQSLLKERLEKLEQEERTIIFYEAPHRLLKTLLAIKDFFGDRDICLARELTKFHEEIRRDKLSHIISTISDKKIIGEYVIVIAGNSSPASASSLDKNDLEIIIRKMLKEGDTVKTIVQNITSTYKLKRSEVYQLALKVQEDHKIR